MEPLSFDIEISDVFDLKEHEDLAAYAPFHISVAATALYQGEERIWFSTDATGKPAMNLTADHAHELLEYLEAMQARGVMVCAWNGLGFDLRWIGRQAGDPALAARIALRSFDPMFQFFNRTGFPVALAKVAAAMGIAQEKLMDGAEAPKRWRAGRHREVMDYCLGDCQMTNLVVRAIQKAGELRWVTTRGTVRSEPLPRLLPVEAVLREPGPDQSWMDRPLPKTKFYDWVREALPGALD